MGLLSRARRRDPATASVGLNGSSTSPDAVERRTLELGRAMLDAARSHQSGPLSRAFWSDKLMTWSMQDAAFKTQLFRFVDCYPALRSSERVHAHLREYLTQPGVKLPPGMELGLSAGGLAQGLLNRTIASQIEGMAGKFIAGIDAADALPKLAKLWKRGVAFSVDLLGEACVSEAEAMAYQKRYLDLVETLPAVVASWKVDERLERDHLGPIPRVNVSIKISSLSAKTDPADFDRSVERTHEGLRPVLESARRLGVFVNFDMESHALKDLTLELFMRSCERIDFHAGLAMQAYLRSGPADAARLIDWSRRTGRQVTVRLVKGAYWDYETIRAEQHGWPSPVWARKHETDACFEQMAAMFVQATPRANEGGVKLALGSHNLRSIAFTLAQLEAASLPAGAIELQMLYGMADALKDACADRGLRLREYVPVGAMIPGMAYLVRRLLENTSNESWLRAGFLDDASPESLLAKPAQGLPIDLESVQRDRAARHQLSPTLDGVPFNSEPPRDFADRAQRDAFRSSIDRSRLPDAPHDATREEIDGAVGRASKSAWAGVAVAQRAAALLRAASIMRLRRDELAGLIIRENHKNWRNADAEVCEAIDFCDFYAREAVVLFEPKRLGRFTGEINELVHDPRGIFAVIGPWNFPLAIPCGMAVAALVTANTVLFKPAEQTPRIARVLVEILHEAGIPRDAIQLIPGDGAVGAALVGHDRVDGIAFTGSMQVGRLILQQASANPGVGRLAKHVVCETGGKNAIIVDSSADLDEAVLGVRDSAFGFAGQKCSACSRAIVLDDIHDTFLHRLIESTRSLTLGDPFDPGTDLGPLIDDEAADKVRSYLAIAKSEGRVELAVDQGGRSIGPQIVSGMRPEHRLAREEVFGPVLAVMRVRDFDEAIRLAEDVGYRLTGGVFSRTPSHLEKARRTMKVGNLYINRGITGALVGRQPFGGFGLSGLGTKAGGRGYLDQFVVPRVISENAMRRGFAPE
jgi:RHH-type proline utilization regulon transcriptional repressor/proline dehydrogenase/delta 1-pyrroline-5-carboxylate dehydrogenase